MPTVYLVMQGYYSDRGVVKAFLDEDKAYAYANQHNAMHEKAGNMYYGYECSVEDYEISDGDFDTADCFPEEWIEVWYDPAENSVVKMDIISSKNEKFFAEAHEDGIYKGRTAVELFRFITKPRNVPDVEFEKGRFGYRLADKEKECAYRNMLKVAQDRYAQYKAREEEVC